MMPIKPNLIGIGGQKCASTWLSECLRSHPDIFMSSPKELRYFADNKGKGLSWYFSFFKSSEHYKYRGEFSSNYIYFPESAVEIRETLGPVKVIAVVREPATRALSHIKHLIRDGNLPPMSGEISINDLKEILDYYPQVISNSLYQPGLIAYIETFGKDNVFVTRQSDCQENGLLALESLWTFLRVKHDVEINEASKVVSEGINPKNQALEKFRRYLFRLSKYRASWLINAVKKTGVSEFYRKLNKGDSLNFSDEASDYLSQLSADDWEATQKMISTRNFNCEDDE